MRTLTSKERTLIAGGDTTVETIPYFEIPPPVVPDVPPSESNPGLGSGTPVNP